MAHMTLARITEPSPLPVTLAEAKAQCRVPAADTREDVLLGRLLKVAVGMVEQMSNRALATQTWEMRLPGWPYGGVVDLPVPPAQAITHVKYRDTEGVLQTLDASTYLLVGQALAPAPGEQWPQTQAGRLNGIEIRWTAGYNDGSNPIPPDLEHAILMLLAHLFENREASAPIEIRDVPWGVRALAGPYRWYSV